MANALTGDFDVVAEFAMPAANRVLATLHRGERVPHSVSVRVDDTPQPAGHPIPPVLVASASSLGVATANHQMIGPGHTLQGAAAVASFGLSQLDAIVNIDAGAIIVKPQPSNLRGSAQVQIASPTLDVPDGSGSRLSAKIEVRARYFPDPQTSPLAEFIHGTLQLNLAVNQVATQVGNVIDVNLKSESLGISFTPIWTSGPLAPGDIAGIDLMVRNALRSSFLPSTATLPSNIHSLQFKTLLGAPHALALLLNVNAGRGNPSSLNNVFLAGSDDFAFGVSAEFVTSAFQPALDRILTTPVAPVKFNLDLLFTTIHVTYTLTLNSVTIQLRPGAIVLSVKGHAHTPTSYLPDFDFTVTQNFGLQPDRDTADLVVGSASIDTSSAIVNLFKSGALQSLGSVRDQALAHSNVFQTVRQMFSAQSNLGGFLTALLNSARTSQNPQQLSFQLGYSSVDIQPAGIVLHGSLGVDAWPQPHVEFEQIPVNDHGAVPPVDAIQSAPDYTALNSWIPGGSIQQFEWSRGSQPPFLVDQHRFVYLHPPPVVVAGASAGATPPAAILGYRPLCLTLRGTRIASAGSAVPQPVSQTYCALGLNAVLNGLKAAAATAATPFVSVTQPGPGGLVQVTGHTLARVDRTGANMPNVLVHFADEKSAADLRFLERGVAGSNRGDAPTAIVAVLHESQLAKALYTDGVIFTEEQGGAWERAYGVNVPKTPATFLFSPRGHLIWKHQGSLDASTLAGALTKTLEKNSTDGVRILGASVTKGQRPPNFLFEIAEGHELTLRKLTGRSVTLAFWRSSLRPSIDTVVDLQKSVSKGGAGTVLLAICDGETSDAARRTAKAYGFTALVVGDPERSISGAYGINAWPTIVFLDPQGAVRDIRYSRSDAEGAAR
jgi:peroxiredoxin